MQFEISNAHGWIVRELAGSRSTGESMAELVELCQSAQPHPDWERLRALPYGDLTLLIEWVQQPFREEPPLRPLRGLWFGLFNPEYDDEAVADIYVSGSERFDADPGDNEWAVSPIWWPEARYAMSSVLAAIYRIAYRTDGLGNDAEYPLCLAYGTFAVRELLNRIDPTLILGKSESLGVAVGFDSGDFVLLGEFGRCGWVNV